MEWGECHLNVKERRRHLPKTFKIVWCYCRNCGKKYDEAKSRADYKGYCSQACLHEKAIKHGFKKSKAKSWYLPSEYEVLNKANLIGSIRWEDTQ